MNGIGFEREFAKQYADEDDGEWDNEKAGKTAAPGFLWGSGWWNVLNCFWSASTGHTFGSLFWVKGPGSKSYEVVKGDLGVVSSVSAVFGSGFIGDGVVGGFRRDEGGLLRLNGFRRGTKIGLSRIHRTVDLRCGA